MRTMHAVLLAASVGLGLTHFASAAFVEQDLFNSSGTNSVANYSTAPNLLTGLTTGNGGITNVTGNFTKESSGGVPVLNDGSVPAFLTRDSGGPFEFGSFADGGGGTSGDGGKTITYNLAQTSDITSIVSLGGWQDNGRDQQGYTVAYALASAPATFIDLNTVNWNPSGPGATPVATSVTLSGTLAGVSSVRFTFNDVENNHTGYDELEVFGTASTPEPASLSLLGFAGVGLLARRREA